MDSDGTFAYEGGGYAFYKSDNIDEFGKFDPVANTWTPLAPVPDLNNLMASGVYAPNVNKLFVFGGLRVSPATVVDTTRIYDIATNTWSTGAPMPDVRAFMASGYYNGKIYLVGGYSSGSIAPAFLQTWEYDPVANTFATKTSIPASAGFGGAGWGWLTVICTWLADAMPTTPCSPRRGTTTLLPTPGRREPICRRTSTCRARR